MAYLKLPAISAVGCAVILLVGAVHAQSLTSREAEMQARLETLSQALADQKQRLLALDTFQQQYAAQKIRIEVLEQQLTQQQAALDQLQGVVSWDRLATQRGAGKPGEPDPSLMAQAPAPAPTPAATKDAATVGKAPAADSRPPEVAPLFEQPGVLTPKGHYVLEPSLQYGYSSTNRVALVGYTIIPALLIGLIDVREVKRNTFTAAMSARFGVSNRLELEVRAPYIYRSDDTVSREINAGTASDRVFAANGASMGDLELGARYQLNDGGIDSPFYIGALRFKSRTGKDPFEVVTDCVQRCVGNASGTGLPLDLPTGSGFNSLQAGLTVLFPSDPAVFFGSISYLHNFSRDNVTRRVLNGQEEFLGTISPGDVIGFNFGMGLALNEKSSFSIGYDHSSVGRTERDGEVLPGSVRTQLGTLLLGYAYRLSPKTSLNVSVGAGLTRDTPDLSLTVRLPMTF